MANGVLKIRKGIQLVPNSGSVVSANGDIAVNGSKIEAKLGGTVHTVVTEDQNQTLTLKTLTSPTINTPDINGGTIDGAIITGGDAVALDNFSINDNSTHDLIIDTSSGLTGDKTLTFDVNDANRTIDLSGNLVLGGNLTTTGTVSLSGSSSGTNTGDVTLAAVGSSPNANAASLSGQVLTIQPADATNPGVVSTGTQTFGGVKTLNSPILNNADLSIDDTDSTFSLNIDSTSTLTSDKTLTFDVNDGNRTIELSGNLTVSGSATISGTQSGTNTGDVTLGAIGSTPNANAASLSGQVLNLEPASASFGGVVSTTTQSFAGAKTFTSGATVNSELIADGVLGLKEVINSSSTGANAAITGLEKSVLIVTNASLTSIASFSMTGGSTANILVLMNNTGNAVTIVNEYTSATAANRIQTGTNSDLSLANNSAILLVYNASDSRWQVVGGSGTGGSYTISATQNINASGTISVSATSNLQTVKVQGNSAAVTASNTPFGTGVFNDGVSIRIIGQSNTNTVTLTNNDISKGLILNGSATLTQYRCIEVQYDATVDRFLEISRNF